MTRRLTAAQAEALRVAEASGGEIETTGMDRCAVRTDVAHRLHDLGLLRNAPSKTAGGALWRLTDAGRAWLADQKASAPPAPGADRTPFIVHCGACRHEWAAAYFPMEAGRLTRLLRGVRCPNCGGSSRAIFCGPATQSPAATETGTPC